MSNNLKKGISIFTSITTILWLSGVAMLAPMTVTAQDIVDGDIVSPDAEFTENGTTYYPYDVFIIKIVGDKTFKRLILNPEVFESYGHLKWENIKTISADTVAGYTTSDLVYPDTDGDGLPDGPVYKLTPDGDTGTKQHLDMTPEQFVEQGYDWDSVYVVNSVDINNYTEGTPITVGGDEEAATLTVGLAADTPAADIVVPGAARVPFTKINLTATGGDVVVDSLTIQRTGTVAEDGAFDSVAVILDSEDGDQLGNNKTLNSSHQAVIYDDFTVKDGTTRSIYLCGNMASDLASYVGQVPSLTLAAMTLKGDATLDATLPITGNSMTVNNSVTIGTATVSNGGNNPSASTQSVGTTNYTVSSIKIAADATEKITVKKIVFTQDGSADATDVQNVKLVNANTGEVLATIEQPDSKTLTFNPNLTIDKGKNVTFDLKLDIVDGSGRKISYDIDQKTDILIKGETYGYYITPSYSNTSRPYWDANDTTIGEGSLRIEAVSVSPTKIAENKSDVVLGKFKFVAKGEEIKITSIGWKVVLSSSSANYTDVTNLTVYDPNGNVVAGPSDPSGSGTEGTATTTDTIIVPVGETIYTVKGDLSDDFTADDTVQVKVLPSIVTARGMTTDNSITPDPADWISSTNLTVKAASLAVSVSSDPAAQTVVAGTQDFTFAKYVFDASDSGCDIKVTQVKVPVITSGSAYPDMVTGIELWDGGTKISVDSDSIEYSNTGTTAGGSATTTLNITSGALVISAGTSRVITVKADIGTGVTSGTLKIGLQSNGVTATDDEGNSIDETITASQGQTMTLTSGGTLNLSAMTDPASALVVAGSDGVAVGKFTMQAKYEDITVDKIGITLADPDGGVNANEYDQVISVALYEDGVADPLGSIEITTANATITPSSLVLSAGESKNFTLKATFAELNDASPAQSGAGLKFKITGIDATGSSAGSSSITKNGLDLTFNTFSIVKSVPTVTMFSFSGSDMITGNGVVSLMKFKVTADSAGPVSLYKFTFGISTTTVSLSDSGYYLYESTSEDSLGDVLAQGSDDFSVSYIHDNSGGAIIECYFDVNNDNSGTIKEQRIINADDTKYYTLRGTVSGHTGTVDDESISVVFAGDSGFAYTSLLSADDVDGKDQDDFIWSDLNADLYSSSTATHTAMFMNGYRVPGVPTNSSTPQTVTD